MELSFTLTETEFRQKFKAAMCLIVLRIMAAQAMGKEQDASNDCDEVFDQIFKK